MGRQLFDLFPAAPEDERVAAFQAHHTLALPGQLDQLLVDLVLRHGMLGAALADIDPLGITPA